MIRTLLCLVSIAYVGAAEWTVGWKQAVAKASASQQVILADFTGSDWCGWCIKLKAEVFDTPEFAAWATKKAVLLEVDFPRAGSLSEAQLRENAQMAAKYGIEGFPTILLLTTDGTVIGRLGYQPGGPQAWTAAADQVLAGRH